MPRTSRAARRTGIAALAAGALAAATAVYAFGVEPRWLALTRTRVKIPGLPAPLRGLRVALLTDFHLGEGTPASLLRRACRLAMRERPDLVALTGDFVSASHDPDAARARFGEVMALLDAELRAPLGVYAVPGNHDHRAGADAWHRRTAPTAITDLTNRAVERDVGGARLRIAGVDDYQEGDPRPEQALAGDDADCTLLLAHNPEQAEHARRWLRRVDLVLSGHTHGGQVRLPLVGALEDGTPHAQIYEEGLVRRPWTQVYVSRGIGTARQPIRFLARPEVAILELDAA